MSFMLQILHDAYMHKISMNFLALLGELANRSNTFGLYCIINAQSVDISIFCEVDIHSILKIKAIKDLF